MNYKILNEMSWSKSAFRAHTDEQRYERYLIELWVESLFYDCRFVLGFLVNVWL